MLLREGDGVFAAFGHPQGPEAYYANVLSEREAHEAALAAEIEAQRAAKQAALQARLDSDDPAVWAQAVKESLSFSDAGGFSDLRSVLAADMQAMTNRLAETEGVFYPTECAPDADVSDFTRAMAGPALYGTQYSRSHGILSHCIGPVVMACHPDGAMYSERYDP